MDRSARREIVTRSSFRRERDFTRWNDRVKSTGYFSITEFLEHEYFESENTATVVAEILEASIRTVRNKLRLFDKPLKPVDLSLNPPDEKKRHVHWIFECGCEYEGSHYRPSACKVHGASVAQKLIKCHDCGDTIPAILKSGTPVRYCNRCKELRRMKARRKSKKAVKANNKTKIVARKDACTTPGCKNPKGKDKRFLCNRCYKTSTDNEWNES